MSDAHSHPNAIGPSQLCHSTCPGSLGGTFENAARRQHQQGHVCPFWGGAVPTGTQNLTSPWRSPRGQSRWPSKVAWPADQPGPRVLGCGCTSPLTQKTASPHFSFQLAPSPVTPIECPQSPKARPAAELGLARPAGCLPGGRKIVASGLSSRGSSAAAAVDRAPRVDT